MKLTKDKIKQLIMEEIASSAMPSGGSNRSLAYAMPSSGHLKNFPKGDRPNNHNYQPFEGKPPYETGDVENHIGPDELLDVNGNMEFKLVFDDDELSQGRIYPVGEYKFQIDKHTGQLSWVSEVPFHVENNSDLEKQIKDYSGRED
jgi:hypothetical protein